MLAKLRFFFKLIQLVRTDTGARDGVVGWGTALQVGRSRVRFPMALLEFFHWHNPSGCTMDLRSTQPLTEMSTRNVSWGVKAARAYGWQPYHLMMSGMPLETYWAAVSTQTWLRPVTTCVCIPEAANTVRAPDDERYAARNMLNSSFHSYLTTAGHHMRM